MLTGIQSMQKYKSVMKRASLKQTPLNRCGDMVYLGSKICKRYSVHMTPIMFPHFKTISFYDLMNCGKESPTFIQVQ